METQSTIVQRTGFAKGSFPVKYLGVPLSPWKWNAADCHGLVDKITKRINYWTTRHLSYAGRIQLINSVLFSLHTYWISLFILSKKIISRLKIYARAFYSINMPITIVPLRWLGLMSVSLKQQEDLALRIVIYGIQQLWENMYGTLLLTQIIHGSSGYMASI